MLEQITYYMIFGKPLIMYLGIIVLLSFLFTASIAILNKKGINKIPMKCHIRMAVFSIILALLHGMLGMLAYF